MIACMKDNFLVEFGISVF